MNVKKNKNVAKFVFHQGGKITIFNTVGVLFHMPSELAAFTLKL